MNTQIFIRSRQREEYVGEDGNWSAHAIRARLFSSATEAEQFCRTEMLRDVDIVVLRMGRPPMYIPIFSKQGEKASPSTSSPHSSIRTRRNTEA
jgi:hypothetical protein